MMRLNSGALQELPWQLKAIDLITAERAYNRGNREANILPLLLLGTYEAAARIVFVGSSESGLRLALAQGIAPPALSDWRDETQRPLGQRLILAVRASNSDDLTVSGTYAIDPRNSTLQAEVLETTAVAELIPYALADIKSAKA